MCSGAEVYNHPWLDLIMSGNIHLGGKFRSCAKSSKAVNRNVRKDE